VVHSLEASQRRVYTDPSPELVQRWRSRRTHEHPLVWTHRTGRKSLVLGASADYVVGMDLDEGRALLDSLLERATVPAKVYSHSWSIGDTVIWDNRGVLHRAAPYDPGSQREMLRTTVLGDEPNPVMTPADQHPLRLTPLPADEWDESARAALASLIPAERANPVGAGNVLSTMVRHPDLTAAYLPFNAYLLTRSTLSPRVREVALLRVVHRSNCGYLRRPDRPGRYPRGR
jgi:hypothetical protein